MAEKKILPKMPWKWFILGIAINLLGTAFFMEHIIDAPGASPYNRAFSMLGDLYDDGFFIGALMLVGLIPALTSFGRRIGPDKYALLYTFWHTSFATSWMARVIVVYSLSWYKDPTLTAKMLPPYFSIPLSEVNKFLVGGTPDINAIIPVLTWWTIATLMLAFTQYSIGLIFRRQLIEVERLPFPWQIPTVEIIRTITSPVSETGKGGILREKILWYAFGAAWLVYVWDILRVLSRGSIPRLPLRGAQWGTVYVDLTPQIGGCFPVAFDVPSTLVFLGFIPLDILSTLLIWQVGWFTVWGGIGQAVGIYPRVSDRGSGAVESGIRETWSFPKLNNIDMGVVIGIALFLIWNSRDHLRNVLGALRGRKDLDDPGFSYKISVPLFFACLIIWWAMWIGSGAIASWSLIMIVWQLLGAIGLMRIRGEFWRGGNGLGWGLGIWGNYTTLMSMGATTQFRQSPSTFVTLALAQFDVRDVDNKNDFCTRVPDCLKVSADVGGIDRQIIVAIILSTIAGILFAAGLRMWIGYSGHTVFVHGEQYWGPTGFYNGTAPAPSVQEAMPIYWVGTALGFVLMFLKARFAWWPLNPIGIAVVHAGWINPNFTVTIIVSFVVKYLVWKLGGAKAQRIVMLFATGFLGGFYIKELISFIVGFFIIGVPNIPPP